MTYRECRHRAQRRRRSSSLGLQLVGASTLTQFAERAAGEPYLPPVCTRSDTICWNKLVRNPFVFGRDTVQPRPPHRYDLSCDDSPNASDIGPFRCDLAALYVDGHEATPDQLTALIQQRKSMVARWVHDDEVMNDCLLLTVCARLLWLLLVADAGIERAAVMLVVDGVGEEFWYAWINWIDVARSGWPLFPMLKQLSSTLHGRLGPHHMPLGDVAGSRLRSSSSSSILGRSSSKGVRVDSNWNGWSSSSSSSSSGGDGRSGVGGGSENIELVSTRIVRRLDALEPQTPWCGYDMGDGWPVSSTESPELGELRVMLQDALEHGRVPPALSASALLLADRQTHPFALASAFLTLATAQVTAMGQTATVGGPDGKDAASDWARHEIQDLVARAVMHVKSFDGSTPLFALLTSSWPVLAAWDRLVHLGPAWWVPTRCPALYHLAYRTRQRNMKAFLYQLRTPVNSSDTADGLMHLGDGVDFVMGVPDPFEVGGADIVQPDIDTAIAHFLDRRLCFFKSCRLKAIVFATRFAPDDTDQVMNASVSRDDATMPWFQLYRLIDSSSHRYAVVAEDRLPRVVLRGAQVGQGLAFATAGGIEVRPADCVGWHSVPGGWRIPFRRLQDGDSDAEAMGDEGTVTEGAHGVLLKYGARMPVGGEFQFEAYVERTYSARALLDCGGGHFGTGLDGGRGVLGPAAVHSGRDNKLSYEGQPWSSRPSLADDRDLLGLTGRSPPDKSITPHARAPSSEPHVSASDGGCEAWSTVLWAEDGERERGRREAQVWTDAARTLAYSVRGQELAGDHRRCHGLELGAGNTTWPPGEVAQMTRRPFIVIIPGEWPVDLDASLLADGLVVWRVDWPLSHLPAWMPCNHQKTLKKTAAVRLRLWELENYARIVYLDIDMLVVGSLEHLFRLPVFAAPRMEVNSYSASSRDDGATYLPPLVNLGLMVLQPSKLFLTDVVAELKRGENASIATFPLIANRSDDRVCFQSMLDAFLRFRGSERLGDAMFRGVPGQGGAKFIGCRVPQAPVDVLRFPVANRHHCVLSPLYNFMATDPHLDWQLEFVRIRRLQVAQAMFQHRSFGLQVGPIRVLHWPGQPKPWGVRSEQRTVFDHEWWATHRQMCAGLRGGPHQCFVEC